MARDKYPLEWLDRKLGTLLARVAGTFFALAGLAAGWSVVTLDDFSLATYWPVLALSSAMLIAAVVCFRSRPSFLDMMSETPLSPSEAEARRGNMAIDDQRGREHQRRDRDERSEVG